MLADGWRAYQVAEARGGPALAATGRRLRSTGCRGFSRCRCLGIAPRDMSACDVAECQRRPERDAGAGIVASHDARHVVAGGIEPFDRTIIGVECAGVLVGLDAAIDAEIADHHFDRVEGPVLDRREAGVRSMQGIALKPVVGARPFAESGILSVCR